MQILFKIFCQLQFMHKDKCLNCHRFNKSKDILINSVDDFVSNYAKNFLHDYFKVSNLKNYFLNMDINQIVKEKDPTNVVKFENELPPPLKNRIFFFYFKSNKYRHCCKLI